MTTAGRRPLDQPPPSALRGLPVADFEFVWVRSQAAAAKFGYSTATLRASHRLRRRSGINETQAGRLPVRDLGPASPRPGPCFCRLRKTLALKKWLIGRGGGRQHFVGKTPRVGVVCTPSSPAAAPDEEAATATATVQALSPQKRQWRRVLSAAADRR